MDVLLACPPLVDAVSVDQIKEYLEPFQASINFRPEDDADIEVNDVLGEDEDEEIDEELEG